MNEEDYEIVEMMQRYGGSFVKSLAETCHHADPINLMKIKTTWPQYWEEYKEIAKKYNDGK